MADVISTFAELADLMEPEWHIAHVRVTEDNVLILGLDKRPHDKWITWATLRGIEGTFAKYKATGTETSQAIHITLEKKP